MPIFRYCSSNTDEHLPTAPLPINMCSADTSLLLSSTCQF